jgi:hypothetical protein
MAKTATPFLRGGNLRVSLGTTLNGLLSAVPPDERRAMKRAVKEEGWQRGVTYEDDDGKPQPTPILLRPRILGGNQRGYLHEISRVMEHAYAKLYHLWHEHTSVKRLLPLLPREEKWLSDLGPPGRTDDVFFGRFDCSTDFGSSDWVKSTQFFEYNPIGAGGLYVAPTVDDIVMKHVVPALRRQAPTLLLEPNDDPRRVLLETLADHARSLRLKRFNVALCQYKDLPGGIAEFPFHERFFQSLGINAWHVDPRELRLVGDELRYGDHPIDVVYRDHEVSDLAAKEEAGDDVSAIKHALKTGRVVSSLAGEFDHKSAFQVFTSPEFETWFTGAERSVFHKHVPWTRIVEQSKTTGPDGKEVDLLPWLVAHRDEIVLKPNRSYGGEGILMGRECGDVQWGTALARAEAAPGTWVAQGYRPIAEKDFPVIDEDGNLGHSEYFTVLGLYSSEQRLAILGRASQRKVVNIAQKGGVVAVLRLL